MAFRIRIKNAVPRFREFQFDKPLNWEIGQGQNWAVVGPNGAGKTLLTDILQSKIALKEGEIVVNDAQGNLVGGYGLVKSMAFRDIYSLADCKNMYYQQRWNSADSDQAPLAGSLLEMFPKEKIDEYCRLFGIYELLEKRIISLSSGELRKFLITKILLEEPKMLVLDNPFIGLDATSRESLAGMLARMSEMNGLQTILVLSGAKDIPGWVDYILPVKGMSCMDVCSREAFLSDKGLIEELFPEKYDPQMPLPVDAKDEPDYQTTVLMEAVHIAYGSRVILQGLDWEIHKGEKWALLGQNGSGKSTLLSLVCGDNPQAYANKITLFDRKRGSGESIWDIKKRIGYLSPDMHTYYLSDIPCEKIVASGFFDSIGLFQKCCPEQIEQANQWLGILCAGHLAGRSFLKISFGEQRLVLLARALVKNPELLILDEPLHGLDQGKKNLVRSAIESFCRQQGKTLIYVTHYKEEIPACVDRFKTLVKH